MTNLLNEKKSEVMAYKQQMEENERYYKEIAKVIVTLFSERKFFYMSLKKLLTSVRPYGILTKLFLAHTFMN